MSDKETFIREIKNRTKRFAIDSISFANSLKKGKASDVITYQFIKSATSTGANYRAACRARSKAEFYSKICIVVEESDESMFWLELIKESGLSSDIEKLEQLIFEASEITKIMAKAKETTGGKNNK
jgi:four helix bundle protein